MHVLSFSGMQKESAICQTHLHIRDDKDSLKGAWWLTLRIVTLTTAVMHVDYWHLHCQGRLVEYAWLHYILEFNHFWVKDKEMTVVFCAILINLHTIWPFFALMFTFILKSLLANEMKNLCKSSTQRDLIRLVPSMALAAQFILSYCLNGDFMWSLRV